MASESMTKTTLDDLFDTLKKLEEEEQLATARPDKKNSWCMYYMSHYARKSVFGVSDQV